MFLRSSFQRAGACLLVAVLSGPVHGDDVASFLESRGLDRLLAIHLEEGLDELSGDARGESATRLARLYAQLLMNAESDSDRAYLEARGLQLLKGIPLGDADDLRVELLNGRYLVAEDIAERHRLRLGLGGVGFRSRHSGTPTAG